MNIKARQEVKEQAQKIKETIEQNKMQIIAEKQKQVEHV